MAQTYLRSLTPRIYWSPPDAERDRPVMGAIIGDQATLIVETGASPAHAALFRSGLAEIGGAPPRYAVLTHWHWDHVFGTATLNLQTLAHQETRRKILEMARLDWRDHAIDTRLAAGQEIPTIAYHVKMELSNAQRAVLLIVPPEITFTNQVEINLGGLNVQVQHVGGDHTSDSSIVIIPAERVAFLGDCFYGGFAGGKKFYTIERLLPLLNTLEALPVDHYILAHDPEPLPRAQFLREIQQIRQIADLVKKKPGREMILRKIPVLLGEPVNENQIEVIELLLNGLNLAR